MRVPVASTLVLETPNTTRYNLVKQFYRVQLNFGDLALYFLTFMNPHKSFREEATSNIFQNHIARVPGKCINTIIEEFRNLL